MKAQRVFKTIVNLFILAFFLLPVAAMINYTSESLEQERKFREQQKEYMLHMSKQIKEYNEMVKRAAK